MTVLDALSWANQSIKMAMKGEDATSPMLDAQVLLSVVLDVPKSWLFTHFATDLRSHEQEKFTAMIGRRMAGEPVAYILQKKEWYGRSFFVDKRVLIPRPETELLVDLALKATKEVDPARTVFADVGTGSGAIAVTACLTTSLPTYAIDVSEDALEVAKRNATDLAPTCPVTFLQGDLLSPLFPLLQQQKENDESAFSQHLIVTANLPYIPDERRATLPVSVVGFEPSLALFGGNDGLGLYRRLVSQLKTNRHVLPSRVTLLAEMETTQAGVFERIVLEVFPYGIVTVHAATSEIAMVRVVI